MNNSLTAVMRIGYPCANRTQKLHTNHSFQMKSFGIEKIKEKVAENIRDLKKMLEYNLEHDLLFFRIGSEFVPFASHQLMRTLAEEKKWRWQDHFAKDLRDIGNFVLEHKMRISMHPDHFCLINSTSEDILQKSIYELEYHADLFECMQLDSTHKFQIHVGGVYSDKQKSMQRFVDRYNKSLSDRVKRHLVIENDDHLFSLDDCIWIHERCGVPILFDTLHHECLNTSGETQRQAFKRAAATWKRERDGIPMVDYSSQSTEENAKRGKHADRVNMEHFELILCNQIMRVEDDNGLYIPMDVMLEIKDKESSALDCIAMFQNYRQKYHAADAIKITFTEQELERENKEIMIQAAISNRDAKGIKKEKEKKIIIKKKTSTKRKAARPTKKPKRSKKEEIKEEEYDETEEEEDNEVRLTPLRITRSASKRKASEL